MTHTKSLQWKVSGMDCSGCKLNIERVLSKINGVSKGDVNFLSAQMSVEFDPEKIQASAIETAVTNLGFGVELLSHEKGSPASSSTEASALSPHVAFRSKIIQVFMNKNTQQLGVAAALFLFGFLLSQYSAESNPFLWPMITILAGFPILKKAYFGIRSGLYFSIESLMSLAVIGSLFIGAAEEAAMVVVLFLLGEWLEGFAASRARKNIGKLLDLAPQKAWKVLNSGIEIVDASTLLPGDLVEVKPGSRVPTDGEVLTGESQVDESLVTGEATPIFKKNGDVLTAGSLNFEGLLRFKVTSTVANNSLSQVLLLIEKAEGSKAPTERFIERFSRVYTPFVVALASSVAIIPPLFFSEETFSTWIYRALGVLLIGCPCALVISVPATISAAIARGARLGILIKSGAALETIAKARSICLDKTGTITRGLPTVQNVVASSGWEIECVISLAGSVAQASEHPLAKAILKHAKETGTPLLSSSNASTQSGQGMSGLVNGTEVKVVSPRSALLITNSITNCHIDDAFLNEEESKGYTVSAVVVNTSTSWQCVGWFSFEDKLKSDAVQAVAQLKELGFQPMLLTGDSERATSPIRKALSIESKAQLLPIEKFQAIDKFKISFGPVIMVGDGINDAPALAAADVGVAFASGTEIAAERSDVVLMGEKLGRVVDLIKLSRASKSVVVQNISFAVGLKAIFLLTTIFGYTGLWVAILSDTGATVLVTLNALRILGWKGAQNSAG
jgi:Zn2+/Cd2+-exporting ATPase